MRCGHGHQQVYLRRRGPDLSGSLQGAGGIGRLLGRAQGYPAPPHAASSSALSQTESQKKMKAPVLFLICGLLFISGCMRTVKRSGYSESPDARFRLFVYRYGAWGKAWVEETKKTGRIFITDKSTSYSIFVKDFQVDRASALGWNAAWTNGTVALTFFDYGPGNSYYDVGKGGPKRQLKTLSFSYDPASHTFIEIHPPSN